MKNWELVEEIFRKPLEGIIDITTGNWKCKPCETKLKYVSEDFIKTAAKEKRELLKNGQRSN